MANFSVVVYFALSSINIYLILEDTAFEDKEDDEADSQNYEQGIESEAFELKYPDLEIRKAQIALDQLDHDGDVVKTKDHLLSEFD